MDEISSLAAYARLRGVLLLPEFDAPGHAAYGWQSWPAEKGAGNLTTCMGPVWKDEMSSLAAEPPSGQLNPVNEKVYEVRIALNWHLYDVRSSWKFRELLSRFICYECWQKTCNCQYRR